MKKEFFLAVALGLLAGCATNHRVESSFAEYGFSYDLASSPVPGASSEELERLAFMPSSPPAIASIPQYRFEPSEEDLTLHTPIPHPVVTETPAPPPPRVVYILRPPPGPTRITNAPIIQESAGAQPPATTTPAQPATVPVYVPGGTTVFFDTNGTNNLVVQNPTNQISTNPVLLQTNVSGTLATNRSISEPAGTQLVTNRSISEPAGTQIITNSILNSMARPSSNSVPRVLQQQTQTNQSTPQQNTQPVPQQSTQTGTQQTGQSTSQPGQTATPQSQLQTAPQPRVTPAPRVTPPR